MTKETDLKEALLFLVRIRENLWQGSSTPETWQTYHELSGVVSRISRVLQSIYRERGEEGKAQRLHMNEASCLADFQREYEGRHKDD